MRCAAVPMTLFGVPELPVGRPGGGRTRRPAVGLGVCVLGSGSGGNCTAIRDGQDLVLMDLGFGPRTTQVRLQQAGAGLEQVRAACLTHLDQDHFRPSWCSALVRWQIRLFVHHWHAPDLARVRGASALFDAGLVELFDEAAFDVTPVLQATPTRLQHDRQGTIGYRIESRRRPYGGAVGYATDLGHAPARLVQLLSGVDLLCLECNYDEQMTIHSSRPSFVNRRNLSDSGHLSNEQAFEAARAIDLLSPPGLPRHVLLMHRSQQCNHPTKVRRVFEQDPLLSRRVCLTEQRRRTRWFTARPPRAVVRAQMAMAF